MNNSNYPLPLWSFPDCPRPPNWGIDWDKILTELEWLKPLKNCPQSPIYHAEGDVLTHTCMVCEALVSSEQWRQLEPIKRSLLFAAALLHDIGKPAHTTIESEGQISSKGHVRQGARMARKVLWEMKVPFFEREQIVNLIQLGGLPLWFWDKNNPQRAIIQASLISQCDLLAILATADVRGRICADQSQLLEKIEFFQEYCQEHQCLTQAWQFPSDYSRFIYFQKEAGNPYYEAYDDTQCEVILMSGLPASGKDTWIQENSSNLPVISLDQIRQNLKISPTQDQGVVINHAKEIARNYLRSSQSFIWNATNTTRSLRAGLIHFLAEYKAKIKIVYLETGYEELLRRNAQREDPVPVSVIEKLASRLDIPNITEAHHVTWMIESPIFDQV
jgi:putative nucleotidyltransferase with HDIG domain